MGENIKVVISYLLGFVCAHLLLYSCSIVVMILSMAFGLDESMSVLIYMYIGGGLSTYLFYNLFTHKKISKLFKYCWLIVGVLIFAFYSSEITPMVYNFMYNHFMKSVHDYYYSIYDAQNAFTLLLEYVLCQLGVFIFYFIAKLCLRFWSRMSAD